MREQLRWVFVLLGAALAWMAHLLVMYAVGESACVAEGTLFEFLGFSASAWAMLVSTLVCLGFSAWAGLTSWRGLTTESAPNKRFMSLVGIASSAIFLASILAQAVPPFFLLRGC